MGISLFLLFFSSSLTPIKDDATKNWHEVVIFGNQGLSSAIIHTWCFLKTGHTAVLYTWADSCWKPISFEAFTGPDQLASKAWCWVIGKNFLGTRWNDLASFSTKAGMTQLCLLNNESYTSMLSRNSFFLSFYFFSMRSAGIECIVNIPSLFFRLVQL